MMRLLRIEMLKHSKSAYIMVVAAVTLVIYALIALSLGKIFTTFMGPFLANTGSSFLYEFPYVWYYLPYVLSYFKVFPALLIIYMVCNEFSNRTARQHIIDGMSRDEFVSAKTAMVILVSLVFTVFIFLLCLAGGISSGDALEGGIYLQFPLLYFYELMCYLLFVQMLAFLLRRSLITVFVLAVYSVIVEPVLVSQITELRGWMPLNAINGLVHDPQLNQTLFLMDIPLHRPVFAFVKPAVYGAIFLTVTFTRFRKINL